MPVLQLTWQPAFLLAHELGGWVHGAASSGHKEKYFKEHLITVQGALLLKMPASINICENVCMGKIPSYEKLRLRLASGWGGTWDGT